MLLITLRKVEFFYTTFLYTCISHLRDAKKGKREVYPVKHLHSDETTGRIVLGFAATRHLGITFILMSL